MKSLQALRKQIDTYIETKVESVIKDKMATAIEDVLLPLGQAFIEKTLKNRLETMLNEALESSLAELAEEFDVDYIVSSSTEQEASYEGEDEDYGDPCVESKSLYSPNITNHLRLLAFLQFYKEKHGPTAIPGSSVIYSQLGFSSVDLSFLYKKLVEEGFISRKSGKPSSLKILTPLKDPSDYLDNPLK